MASRDVRRAMSKEVRLKDQRLREAFASMDNDNNGFLDAKELRAVLNGMGHEASEVEVTELMEQLDSDGNGLVDFEEFAMFMAARAEDEEVDKELAELAQVFQSLDMDSSGHLSAQELRRALNILGVRMSIDEIALLVEEIDRNGDGEVSYDEFIAYVLDWEDEEEDIEAPSSKAH